MRRKRNLRSFFFFFYTFPTALPNFYFIKLMFYFTSCAPFFSVCFFLVVVVVCFLFFVFFAWIFWSSLFLLFK